MSCNNIRSFAQDAHKTVDDAPFSSKKGMLFKLNVLCRVLESCPDAVLVMPDPKGVLFDHTHAKTLSNQSHCAFISPAFEGVDDRIFELFSIQRYRLADAITLNGDAAVAFMMESVVRFVPGVVGRSDCVMDDSIVSGLLEYPQYTAPRSFRGQSVPDVLVSGHHQQIDDWKRRQQLRLTMFHRPDLLNHFEFSKKLVKMMDQVVMEAVL